MNFTGLLQSLQLQCFRLLLCSCFCLLEPNFQQKANKQKLNFFFFFLVSISRALFFFFFLTQPLKVHEVRGGLIGYQKVSSS